jgi:hypothetical protein
MKAIAGVVISLSLCGCASHKANLSASPDNAFAVVEIRPRPRQTLRDEIAQEAAVAVAHGLAPFVELTSFDNRRCFLVDRSFDNPDMRRALTGTYIIRVDINRWIGRFGDTGLDRLPVALPGFVELFEGGHGMGPYIDARSWVADAPTAVAPSLGAFVRSFAER